MQANASMRVRRKTAVKARISPLASIARGDRQARLRGGMDETRLRVLGVHGYW